MASDCQGAVHVMLTDCTVDRTRSACWPSGRLATNKNCFKECFQRLSSRISLKWFEFGFAALEWETDEVRYLFTSILYVCICRLLRKE